MSRNSRPNSLWPIHSPVTFLDAWGHNPVDGTVIGHYGSTNVLVEDRRGVRHFGPTWRIETEPPRPAVDLDDLIGGTAVEDDLLV